MNIEELIHDLRARINPQYYDQLGTESYERNQCVMALEYLRQENERLREEVTSLKRYEDAIDKCEGGCLMGCSARVED